MCVLAANRDERENKPLHRTLTTEYTVYQVHHPLTSSQQAAGPHRWVAPAGARTSRGQRTSVQPQTSQWGRPGENRAGLRLPCGRYADVRLIHSQGHRSPSRGCVANTAESQNQVYFMIDATGTARKDCPCMCVMKMKITLWRGIYHGKSGMALLPHR